MSEGSDKPIKKKMVAGKQGDMLFINEHPIPPGENRVIGIRVGTLPSDTGIYINTFVFRSSKPGPVVLVLSGMHGDEVNGVNIVRKALESGMFQNLASGSVVAIPLLNVYGFINYSRDLPDGKDVNRSFPGNSRGSLASRMASIITRRIMPAIDIGIDFHTGGASRYNYPQTRYTASSDASLEISNIFGARYVLQKGVIKSSLRKLAGDIGVPMVVYEGGEALRFDALSTEVGMQGIANVLAHLGMSDGKPQPVEGDRWLIEKTSWLRASTAGLFEWQVDSGNLVQKGDVLGFITDPYNSKRHRVQAHHSGFIIGHNNAPVVNVGDALFAIGYEYKALEQE